MSIRACPFCGSVFQHYAVFYGSDIGQCDSCGAHGPQRGTSDAAGAAWNRRTPDWEWKYGEIVETTGRRIAEHEKQEREDGKV